MDTITDFATALRGILNYSLFQLGDAQITLWTLLYITVLITLLVIVSGYLKRWLARSLLAVADVEIGVRQAVASIARYAVIALGLIIIIQSAGVDLSALTLLAGAAGLGIGFGLQNIINNFVSGMIILFERGAQGTDEDFPRGDPAFVTRP